MFSPIVTEKAPLILAEINKAKSILLHCHPSPDPDSVGTVLAMKFALESMGKQVTVIQGDTAIPQAFKHFPGAADIVAQNFFETDLTKFDLFLIIDSGSLEMVSFKGPVTFPATLSTVVIDHHATNTQFAQLNLVDPDYPAAAELVFDLLTIWNVTITADIARNVFLGIYTDTGGFRFGKTRAHTFEVAAKCSALADDLPVMISKMYECNDPKNVLFQRLALEGIEKFLGDNVVISSVSNELIQKNSILPEHMNNYLVATLLRSVIGWNVTICAVETKSGVVKISIRTRDNQKFDVSLLATAFGGGGHRAAAGATLLMPLEEAKKAIVAKAKELYNL